MLDKMRYVNHLNEEVVLGVDGIIIGANDIRNYEWSYNTQFNRISSFYQKSKKSSIPFVVYGGMDKANRMFEVFEKDVLNKRAGRLYIGDYYISGYFFASNKTSYLNGIVKGKLSFISEQSMWIKEMKYVYRLNDEKLQQGKGYDYGYPYDYASGINVQSLFNTSFVPASAIITIYGAVENPMLYIAGHLYNVECELKSNEYLVINGYEKTIYKINAKGEKINLFANRNIESYIFEKVPVGQQKVTIGSDFDYDITIMLERSEPEWT